MICCNSKKIESLNTDPKKNVAKNIDQNSAFQGLDNRTSSAQNDAV